MVNNSFILTKQQEEKMPAVNEGCGRAVVKLHSGMSILMVLMMYDTRCLLHVILMDFFWKPVKS